ncbi:MAG TPA: histone deacetylase [Longimicrobiales bacterium]|nr:histone deacetylase [Longimicrobiales bacterium]
MNASLPVGFYMHPASPLHDTGWGHPEHQGRLRALASAVGKDMVALHGRVEQREAPEGAVEDVLLVHPAGYVNIIHEMCDAADAQQKIFSIDNDTRVSPATWEAALGSVGGAVAAARAVADGMLSSAFVATRPPGHHATPSRAMGFCLFNNVAVAARFLQASGRAERVLVIDWDVHHGNGTQDVFYEDPTVFYLSLHQSPHFPGTGDERDTGAGHGRGTTLNVQVAAGTPRETYRARFTEALGRSVEDCRPDFILISSGYDALSGDPLGDQLLEPRDFHEMTREVLALADQACGGRVVAVLEGGYDPERLGLATVQTVRALAGIEPI